MSRVCFCSVHTLPSPNFRLTYNQRTMTDTPIPNETPPSTTTTTTTETSSKSQGKELKLSISEHTFDNLSRKAEFFGLPIEELSANILLDYLAGSVGRPHITAPNLGTQGKGQVRLITGPSWQTKVEESNAN